MKGFRDKFKVDIPLLVELIAAIEARTNESLDLADKIIEEIRAASRDVTHVSVYKAFSSCYSACSPFSALF